jgi:hypothetical protein
LHPTHVHGGEGGGAAWYHVDALKRSHHPLLSQSSEAYQILGETVGNSSSDALIFSGLECGMCVAGGG